MASKSVLRLIRRLPAPVALALAGAALPAVFPAGAGAAALAKGPVTAHAAGLAEPSASGFYIRGGGFGHGIGMSQYGAFGFAQHGWSYQRILAHYYEGTKIGSVSPAQTIRVLLQDGGATFSGASRANGKALKTGTSYSVHLLADGRLELRAGGKKVSTFSSPLKVSGPRPLYLAGLGRYRGAFVFRSDGSGGIETVNQLDIEDYVRGVISAEMPSSWSSQALRAQAVAARTYALTSGSAGATFDVYSDTRSQMYEGVAAETASTNAAEAATRGKVVTYHGNPVVTYFFSSSGGHTESIQNVWLGSAPEPWLRGVSDPYDGAGGNPNHRWGYNLTTGQAVRKLGGLVRGSLIGIQVLKHGVSPRIVSAAVVGSKGRSVVSGPSLQQDFGLMSTYMAFTTVTIKGVYSSGSSSPVGAAGTGKRWLTGRVFPTHRGVLVQVQKFASRAWTTTSRIRTVHGGYYKARVSGPGRYRITYGNVRGPAINVR